MTSDDYYFDPTISDAQILAYHAGRAMGASRIILGASLAKLALAAHIEERRNAITALPATPPPIFTEAERSQSWFAGDGPTGDGDADLDAAAGPRAPAEPTVEPAPPVGVRPVATARCVGPTWRDGVQDECRHGVWFKPGEQGRPGIWLHVDPAHSADHAPTVMPDVHDRAVQHENHMNGEATP